MNSGSSWQNPERIREEDMFSMNEGREIGALYFGSHSPPPLMTYISVEQISLLLHNPVLAPFDKEMG
jgi:hypothetical protein